MTNDQGSMPKKAMKSLVVGHWSLVLGPWSFCFIPHPSSFILLLWLFAVGGAVGSFLNVVVYRLPRGMSLMQPGSHCPACKRPIRWRDNIPILGWFLLRGRCRDCKAKIALRYPLVEAITAATFLAVGLVEGLSGGANLPQRLVPPAEGMSVSHLGQTELIVLVSYHLVLLCTLLAAGFIEYDGHRLPLRLMLPALVVGAVAPLVWPEIRPVPLFAGWPGWLAGLADGAAGLAVGALVGLAASYALGAHGATPTCSVGMSGDRLGQVLGPACVGLFLGWQAAVVLGLASMALHLAATALGRKWPGVQRLSFNLFLAAATLGWILTWPDLVRMAFSWGIL
jgi:leader peptidase (prepilin peptidase)/N-methyltransferase